MTALLLDFSRALLLLTWSGVVAAAPVTFGASMLEIPLVAWLSVMAISILGGITALLMKINAKVNDGEATTAIKNLTLYVSSHMFGSVLAGLVFFFFTAHSNVPDYMMAVSIGVSSFTGAKAIEWLTKKIYPNLVELKNGSTKEPPSPT